MSKYIEDVSGELSSLEVYECMCGFHIGLDSSFLDQVSDDISVECPSCGERIVPDKDEQGCSI